MIATYLTQPGVTTSASPRSANGPRDVIMRRASGPRQLRARAAGAAKTGTVLHFTPSVGGGGAETMLCNLIEAMSDSGWRQIVVAVHTGTTGCQAERVRRLADGFYDLESSALLRPALFSKLGKIIQEEKPDVVQTWMHHSDFVGGLVARFCGVKNVAWGVHSRDIFRWPGESKLKAALFGTAIRAASHAVPGKIISCSTTAIDDHAAMGYPREKMTFIANGICTDRFVPSVIAGARTRQALGIPLDAPVIGFVGRFHPVKNLTLFFSAAAVLQQRMPGVHFIMSGGSPETLDEKARAAFDALPDKTTVHFVPFNSTTESLYPAFSLFTLSSDSEALPMTILEAMSCGIPCVTTDAGDCAQVIGDTGLVVPPGDQLALVSAWEKTLNADASTRAALSIRARDRIVSNFSITQVASQYDQTWRSMISNF